MRPIIGATLCLLFGSVALFSEEVSRQADQVTTTETIEFAAGGTIRLNPTLGDLFVEGWDRPQVEITVIKSITLKGDAKHREKIVKWLDKVRITAEKRSATELNIATLLPSRANYYLPPRSSTTSGGVSIEYQVHVPRDSKLFIHHGTGIVLVSSVLSDIEATGGRGDIMLWLPEAGTYAIDAKSRIGTVSSEFDGESHVQHLIGQRFSAGTSSGHRIYLRMGFGGITIKRLCSDCEIKAHPIPL